MSGGQFPVYFLIFFVSLPLGSACFIRNCPIGGKRSVNAMSADIGSHHMCMRCGPGGLGQCVGPDICCGAVIGCFIATEESAVCQQENDTPVPCEVGGAPCGSDRQSRCVADGVCCNDASCTLDSDCEDNAGHTSYQDKSDSSVASILPHDLLHYVRQLMASRSFRSRR
nr:conopressin [Urechis unicinctus]